MKTFNFLVSVIITCIAVACSPHEPQFTVEGNVSNADSSVLYLEKRELNKTTLLDSVVLKKKGNFEFKKSATPYPEFYVLRLKDQVINFSVDSTEIVKIEASKDNFATDYLIEGSEANKDIRTITLAQYESEEKLKNLQKNFLNKEINETDYLLQVRSISDNYKEIALKIITKDFRSPAAYFALFQKVNGFLFFNPYDKKDYKLFAAIATAWNSSYIDSPRTPHLRDYTLIAMKIRKQEEQTPEKLLAETNTVESSQYYNIELPDANNKIISLNSLKGKIVLLDFTLYQAEYSPAHNIALNKIYKEFSPNLEIYQISLDPDIHLWRNAAVNLPWIAVRDSKAIESELIFKFNVQTFPTFFLLNKEGEIVKRLLPSDNIANEIRKIL